MGELSRSVTGPLPGAQKVHVQGSRPDIRVPMRRVVQQAVGAGVEPRPDIVLYDTSGPYSDPNERIDLLAGLAPLRGAWIDERDDTVALDAPTSDYRRDRIEQASTQMFPLRSHGRRARDGACVSQMHYARRGIVTPEMEFVAIRENLQREEMHDAYERAGLWRRSPGQGFGARLPERVTPEFVRDEIAAGRAVVPANINHPEVEPMIIGRNFLVKVNANIGNSARHLLRRRGGGEDGLGHALGRRHGHGPFHGPRHSRDARVDPA